MHSTSHRFIVLVGAGAATLGLCQQANAQSYSIAWSTVDAGGGRVTGTNGYALEGTIGQFDIGVSRSGSIQGEWGFWPGVPRRCRADFDNDGAVNSQDFFNFLSAFFELQSSADFNADGTVNSQDFFDFLNAFFGEC